MLTGSQPIIIIIKLNVEMCNLQKRLGFFIALGCAKKGPEKVARV
jgi:hypothetical protein